MFKKRGKRRRQNFRAATKDLGEDEVSQTLEEIKFLQKYRGKARGIKAGIEEEPEEGEEKKKEESEPAGHLLSAYQQGVAVSEEEKNDKHMEAYIEEELQKRREKELQDQKERIIMELGADAVANSGKGADKNKKPEYVDETEEMLKRINEEGRLIERRGDQNWSLGITEIPLPISVRLKNIEETEKAKAKLLGQTDKDDSKGTKKRKRKESARGNLSTNFNQHQRDYAARMKEKNQAAAGPEKPSAKAKSIPKGGERVPYATDDRVVAKFIKRNRYQRY